MTAQRALLDLGLAWRQFQMLMAQNARADADVTTRALDRITTATRALATRLQALPWEALHAFAEENAMPLQQTREAVRDILKRHPTPQLRSAHDRLHRVLPADGASRRAGASVTSIFHAFIRGVTFFSDQPLDATPRWQGHPIYHRLASCGSGGADTLECGPGMSRDARRVTKARVDTCAIERMIYDALWGHMMPTASSTWNADSPQDAGHAQAVQTTLAFYASCFPGVRLDVELAYHMHEHDLPVRLTIRRWTRTTRATPRRAEPVLQSIETYDKEVHIDHDGKLIYTGFVRCTKEYGDGSKKWTRVQVFDQRPTGWLAVGR